ncbi:hypothetical protein [Novosphingobium sp.]|uniref:hypothetical protein n=1 Tax=Novosphingobium sp. TaxID=1874826 RepID=UPI002736FF64|nr:hypothetical protein [Novosphingobium sp.]MDP3907720.1 hypothetical protein [Novosphingobium sp.]
MRIATISALIALAALTGCNQSKKAEGAGTAAGEILPGSASDAMIPLDSVRSQAPLAPKVENGEKVKAKASDAPEAAAEAPAEAAPAAESAATP